MRYVFRNDPFPKLCQQRCWFVCFCFSLKRREGDGGWSGWLGTCPVRQIADDGGCGRAAAYPALYCLQIALTLPTFPQWDVRECEVGPRVHKL